MTTTNYCNAARQAFVRRSFEEFLNAQHSSTRTKPQQAAQLLPTTSEIAAPLLQAAGWSGLASHATVSGPQSTSVLNDPEP